jgi:hypothetical protein
MQMTGHKTRSVFELYNIVSAGDLRDAAKRLDAVAGTTGTALGTGFSLLGDKPAENQSNGSDSPKRVNLPSRSMS